MKDFFTNLKDNLENRPEPSPTESDWEKMQAKMNPPEQNSRKIPVWAWLAIPFMALMGSNIWFYQHSHNLSERIDSIMMQTDTVFVKQNFYQTDTVYLTNVIYQNRNTPHTTETTSANNNNNGLSNSLSIFNRHHVDFLFSEKLDQPFASNNIQSGSSKLLDFQNNRNKDWKTYEGFSSDNFSNKGNTSKQLENIYSISKIASKESLLTTNQLQELNDLSFVEILQKKKSFRKRMYNLGKALQPNGFQLGILGGFAYPFQSGLENQGGYSFGIQANIEYSNQLSMWVNGSYTTLIYDSDKMDENIGIPVEASPNAEFEFDNAKVEAPSFQYSVGMQYLFNTRTKIKPLVGIGYGVVSLLPYEVVYEFEKINNTNNAPKFILDKDIKQESLLKDFLLIRIGANYKISEHLNINLLSTYRNNIKSGGFGSPNMINIQGGILYKF